MGQKVSPISFRLGISSESSHTWFADRLFSDLLHQQLNCQRFLKSLFESVGVKSTKSHVQYFPQGSCIHSFFHDPSVSASKWGNNTLKPTLFFKDPSDFFLFQAHGNHTGRDWSLTGNFKSWEEVKGLILMQYLLLHYNKAKSYRFSALQMHLEGSKPIFWDYTINKIKSTSLQFYQHHVRQIISHYVGCSTVWSPKRIAIPAKTAIFVVAQVVTQLEQNTPLRQIFKSIIREVRKEKTIQGFKITCAGRIDGSELARVESKRFGQTPLQTLSQKIDYWATAAYTSYGLIGVKVWIAYKSSDLDIKKKFLHVSAKEDEVSKAPKRLCNGG